MLVVGVQLLEELSDVHAGAIREVPGFVLVRGIVTAYIADDEFAEGFEQMRMLVGDHRAPSIVRSEHRAETLEIRTASTRLEPVDGRQP